MDRLNSKTLKTKESSRNFNNLKALKLMHDTTNHMLNQNDKLNVSKRIMMLSSSGSKFKSNKNLRSIGSIIK